MLKSTTYIFSFSILIPFLLGFSFTALGQETDTTAIDIENQQQTRSLNLDRNLDRSMSGGSMTDMGTYSVPNETQYYHAPFEGQESLDRAVEAYRKEMENKLGENWYWQFLKAVSPYIRLQLGVSDFNNMEFVDPDNPLFKSFNSKEKRQ